jgi:Xaa-Pro aminopeptidase
MTSTDRPFGEVEIAGRLERLRAAAAQAGLDALLLTSYPAIYHATGVPIHQFGRPAAAVIPVLGDPALTCSIIELDHVRLQSPIADVRTYHDFGTGASWDAPQRPLVSLVALASAAIAERGLTRSRIGLEDASVAVRSRDALATFLPEVRWEPVSDLVDRQRLVKSRAELDILARADAVADAGMEAMLGLIKPGLGAAEVHMAGISAMRGAALALDPPAPFHLRVDPGVGRAAWSAGHSEWAAWDGSSRVEPGTVLVLIADCVLWGYTGNVERTVVIGDPTPRMRRDFETMVHANTEARAVVAPGARLADVDAAAKRVLVATGHGTRTGSGVGRGIISYEGGWRELLLDVRGYSDVVLEPRVAFSLEPDLRTVDGTYRHCDTIVVTADGCRMGSRIRRDVIVV